MIRWLSILLLSRYYNHFHSTRSSQEKSKKCVNSENIYQGSIKDVLKYVRKCLNIDIKQTTFGKSRVLEVIILLLLIKMKRYAIRVSLNIPIHTFIVIGEQIYYNNIIYENNIVLINSDNLW